MYYLVSNISIPAFSSEIPEVLAVSKHTAKPYLRAQLFLFNTVDYDFEEFHFSNDNAYSEFTATTAEQQMDFEFDTANNDIYKGLPAKDYSVVAVYPNMLVVHIDADDIVNNSDELSVAIYDAVNSYLPVDFIYSYTK